MNSVVFKESFAEADAEIFWQNMKKQNGQNILEEISGKKLKKIKQK